MKCLEFMVSVNIVLKRGSVKASYFFLYHCKTCGMNIKKKKIGIQQTRMLCWFSLFNHRNIAMVVK